MTAGVHSTRVPLVLEEHYKYKDTFSTRSMLNLLDELNPSIMHTQIFERRDNKLQNPTASTK